MAVSAPAARERLIHAFAAERRPPGTALWLVPCRRAAAELDRALAAAGVPLAGGPARPLTASQEHVLIEDVIDAAAAAGELGGYAGVADTRGFAAGVRALVAELSAAGVTAAGFADAGGDRPLAALYARYRETLARLGRVDAAGRCAAALGRWRAGHRGPFAGVRAVFVDGFDAFTRPQWDWVEALGEVAEVVGGPPSAAEPLVLPSPGSAGEGPGVRGEPADPRTASRPGQFPRPSLTPNPSPAEPGEGGQNHPVATVLEAPGQLGEWRMVARRVRELLDAGTPPDRVAVAARHAGPVADLAAEVLAEYAVSADIEGHEPLTRRPLVATLLRAARLPDDGWPFADLAALLRHTALRPAGCADPALPRNTEALLRGLGVPGGRGALEAAVAAWAETPPEPLEDEQAEASARRRRQAAAVACRPFLRAFFRLWDRWADHAPFDRHAAALGRLAADLGLAGDDLDRLGRELDGWAAARPGRDRPLTRGRFLHLAAGLASASGPGRSPRGPGRVRVLSAEPAAALDVDHLFVVGLGERGFPDLSPPSPLLDDAARQRLADAGLPPAGPDRRPAELRLFQRLLAAPRASLTLSYAARDERGQELPPGPFLRDWLDGRPTPPAVERKHMLIEGYDAEPPRSAAERRVRAALALATAGDDESDLSALPADTAAHLLAARHAHLVRSHAREFTPFDGLLRSPAALGRLARWFGPETVFSPTALERYVECPFKFFLQHVLTLEPLEEPGEQVEHARRGSAVHRALSRLHARLRDAALDGTAGELLAELRLAAREYADRAPGPVARRLWELEGERLERLAPLYAGQWRDFAAAWGEAVGTPAPRHLEADFGLTPGGHPPLVLAHGGVEVRLGGRIDRIDVADTPAGPAFWVLDYKTGRAERYTAAGLRVMSQLQLALYALAVERLGLAGEGGRPAGLAYWLVAGDGPRTVLPATRKGAKSAAVGERAWAEYAATLERAVARVVGHVRAGDFPLQPTKRDCTAGCAYARVCRVTPGRHAGKAYPLPLPLLAAGGEPCD